MSDKNIIKVYDPTAGEMKTGTANTKKEVLDKIDSLEQDISKAGKVDTVNSVKPDSNKNIELTGSNIKYKTGASENIGTKIDSLNKDKASLEDLSRSSTIVIANYDSHENSKKGADIIIEKGENAAFKINDAIQSLDGIGGEVKLMEGNYNLGFGIAVNVDGVHLTGIPKATILVQNTNWEGNPYNAYDRNIISTSRRFNPYNVDVEISNLYVKGANVRASHGFWCSGSSKVTNCISENSGANGFNCGDSSTANNCTSINSGSHGFWCLGSSTVNNCVSENNGNNGFYCTESPTVNNCTSINSGDDGFLCYDSSTVANCISENSSGNGFWCSDSSTITNCTSINSGVSGFLCGDSSTVTNCISENSYHYGFFCNNNFKGVCGFNTLIGDILQDNSSSPAVVQYNIIKEG